MGKSRRSVQTASCTSLSPSVCTAKYDRTEQNRILLSLAVAVCAVVAAAAAANSPSLARSLCYAMLCPFLPQAAAVHARLFDDVANKFVGSRKKVFYSMQ